MLSFHRGFIIVITATLTGRTKKYKWNQPFANYEKLDANIQQL